MNLEFYQVDLLGIENVILDVRNNSGGYPRIVSRLFGYLAKELQPYYDENTPHDELQDIIPWREPHFDGNLYTIMSGYSFSATGQLLALLKYQDIGVFIGEESGGLYNLSFKAVEVELSNTGLRLLTTTETATIVVEGLTFDRGIMPDYEMYPTLDDFLYDEDSIMEFIINLINSN